MTTETNAPLTIDIVSDVVCPWCYVGKKRLEAALRELPEQKVAIFWRPFQLDPTIPKEGIPRRTYLERKFGGPEKIAQLHAPLIEIGKAEGIPFAFDKITRSPNTLDAHRLIRWAHEAGRQSEMVSRLFALYFTEGGDIGNKEVLLKAATEAGLDGALVAQLLATEADLDPVIAEINGAAKMGISGVPTFIFASRFAISGAHPAETLKKAIQQSLTAR
ncbi:DsbA family oxidoreductase [Taklimakanibacter lacteus]|uniref:DsbA family oxidoreductase n=1 Tax=Taklimakanibacter lacteus TaxID=2268456 RepID=UPI000E67389D